jgi:hypothetical protein
LSIVATPARHRAAPPMTPSCTSLRPPRHRDWSRRTRFTDGLRGHDTTRSEPFASCRARQDLAAAPTCHPRNPDTENKNAVRLLCSFPLMALLAPLAGRRVPHYCCLGELPLNQESLIAYRRSLRDSGISTWSRVDLLLPVDDRAEQHCPLPRFFSRCTRRRGRSLFTRPAGMPYRRAPRRRCAVVASRRFCCRTAFCVGWSVAVGGGFSRDSLH